MTSEKANDVDYKPLEGRSDSHCHELSQHELQDSDVPLEEVLRLQLASHLFQHVLVDDGVRVVRLFVLSEENATRNSRQYQPEAFPRSVQW